MSHLHVIIPLKRFLTVEQCPCEWRPLDLYLFRDEEIVFYVGQSYAMLTSPRNLNRLIREAGYVVQAEDRKAWLTQ